MNEELKNLHRRVKQLRQEEKWEEVILVLTEIIRLETNPENKAAAYNDRGIAYARKGKRNHAIADYDKAIELQPNHASVYYNRGNVYGHKGEHDRAILDYDKAIELQPNYALAYGNRGTVYAFKGEHDRAIEDYSKVIELQPDDAEGHLNRGIAYNIKGDYDRAIADFKKRIELRPDDAKGHFNRGIAYNGKGEHDRAISDYEKAIGLRSNYVAAYGNRGISYGLKGEYGHAIASFTEVIDLQPDDAKAYFNRGIAYNIKGEHDRAIADFEKTIELQPDDAKAYFNLGISYGLKGEYQHAFEDFVKAGKDRKLISTDPLVYIASQIDSISSENKKRADLFEHYCRLVDMIDRIRETLLYKPGDGEIAHYTSLHALKSLAKKESFRLYNVAYMNDPEEGRTFFEVMKNGIDVEKIFYKNNVEERLHPSPAYIGSFVIAYSESEGQKDNLSLWRFYGKHDSEEAAGACLIFNTEQFAQNISPMLVSDKFQLQNSEGKNVVTRQKSKPEFYRVIYKCELKDKDELLDNLNKLVSPLKEIESFCQSHEKEKEKEALFDLVRKLLDGIRFLFKMDDYKEEQEVRVVHVSYYVDKEEQSERKIATEEIPPRFYLEMPGDVQFSEVILGPKADGVFEWKQWLKEKDITDVRKSEIKFGGSR